MNSEFCSLAPNLPQTNMTNDYPSSDQLQDFLSTLSQSGPIDAFQAPFFDEGCLDSDSLGSCSPFSDYTGEDSFADVISPSALPSPPLAQREEARRERIAHKAETARANRKRKTQVNSNNMSLNNNCDDGGDSDSSSAGSRSPLSDYPDMSMSPLTWDDEEDRRRRLARKAELARVSRKKKKDRIEELESQLSRMQNELMIARQMSHAAVKTENNCIMGMENSNNNNMIPPNEFPFICQQKPNNSDRLNKAMSDFSNPNYLGAFYTAFVDKIREDMLQLDQLQTSMQSSLCLRFVQWIMNQNDKFYEDPTGLWYSLFSQEVGASPVQLAQLLELRKEFALKPPMCGPDVVSQAFDVLRKAMDDSSRLLAAFAQIFSPAQLVQFFQWVERFGPVCIKINL